MNSYQNMLYQTIGTGQLHGTINATAFPTINPLKLEVFITYRFQILRRISFTRPLGRGKPKLGTPYAP
jgi:hypothetical protein